MTIVVLFWVAPASADCLRALQKGRVLFIGRSVSDEALQQKQELIAEAGLSVDLAERFSAYAVDNGVHVYVRYRNSTAQELDGNSRYFPKNSDVPFKSDALTGLVFAQTREEFMGRDGDAYLSELKWLKWQAAVHDHRYYVDLNRHIHLGSPTGPEIYSDVDLFAVVKFDSQKKSLSIVRLGDGAHADPVAKSNLHMINSYVSSNTPYPLIRHGTFIEYGYFDRMLTHERVVEFAPNGQIAERTSAEVLKLIAR